MTVSIVVPFAPDGAERDRNWAYLKERYETLYPDWELVVGTCEGPWRKGVALNEAVKASSGDVLIVSDADVLIAEDALRDAVRLLERHAWVVPHRMVYRLNETATQAVIESRLYTAPQKVNYNLERVRPGAPGGGIAVLPREGFEKVNGMDERFEGWGGEDVSFGFALDTLVGPHGRFDEQLWHLWHEPLPMRPPAVPRTRGRGSEESEALTQRYDEAKGDPVKMEQLVSECHHGMHGGGIVVTTREVVQAVPLDPRFRGWGQEDNAWAVALKALVGPARKGGADLIHLHHPPPERMSRARGNPEGIELRARYFNASRRPDLMLQLVKEARESLDTDGHALHPG